MSRFVHGPDSSSTNDEKLDVKEDEFSDDEEFERDAAEWFDQQDQLVKTLLPVEGVKEVVAQSAEETVSPEAKPAQQPVKEILPPVTSLDFNIPSDLFQAALKSTPGSMPSYWSYSMYRHPQPDGNDQKVKVHYCTSKHTMDYVCKKYFLNEPVLGFDMEWQPYANRSDGPRQNVSLIQIASPSRIGLFHISMFLKNDFVAPTFRQIMEDEGVSKVGVHIQGDCTRLKKYLGVETKGIFELSHLYKLVKYSNEGNLKLVNRVAVQLSVLAQDYLRLPLYKGQSVRSSNWMLPLNERQISYSASDAYAGIQLYHVLEEARLKLDPCPPRPHFAEKRLPIRVAIIEETSDTKTSETKPTETETKKKITKITETKTPASDAVKVKPTKGTPSTTAFKPKDPRITAAELQLQTYRSQKKSAPTAPPSALRTYFIWHNNADLDPEAVAKLLREPPLQTNTVVSYIINSIISEKLPFSRERVKTEVLPTLAPTAQLGGRYRAFVEEVQGVQDTPKATKAAPIGEQ
ncbi:Fc.00g051060.m01.CDS01 [Cosmosporella sp. VM-42]